MSRWKKDEDLHNANNKSAHDDTARTHIPIAF